MLGRLEIAVILISLIITTASPVFAQYNTSSRINSLLRERSIGGNKSASPAPAVSSGSIADRFRQRIAAVHGGSAPAHTPPRASIAPRKQISRNVASSSEAIRRRLAATRAERTVKEQRTVASGRKGNTSFFSNVERLKRQRAARVRGEMPYTKPAQSRPIRRKTAPAASSNVRERLQAIRRQSINTLGAFRRSLTSDESTKLNNWMRKNKFHNVQVARRNGETALHRAASQGNREIATLILCSGARVNAEDRHGETALQQASARGQGDMVQLLLRWNADPNVRDLKGKTALQKASAAGHLSIVKLLIGTSADLNARCDLGLTSLHEAAGNGHIEIVKVLVATGSDVNVRCSKNETAVQKSASAGHNDIARLLLQHK